MILDYLTMGIVSGVFGIMAINFSLSGNLKVYRGRHQWLRIHRKPLQPIAEYRLGFTIRVIVAIFGVGLLVWSVVNLRHGLIPWIAEMGATHN